jgi:PAS domain S-box-containing protein
MSTNVLAFDASLLAPRPDGADGEYPHLVQFYDDETFLLDAMTDFIGTGLEAGEASVVIATRPHRERLEARLTAQGVDVPAAREQGRYVAVDAAYTVAQLLVDGWPDETRFADRIGGIIAHAARGRSRRVRAFGEMVALLWANGNGEAAIRLEQLWNGLAHELQFALLCAYPMRSFHRQADGEPFARICGEHARVVPTESYTALATANERLRSITQLQQKAGALQTETAERRQAEKSLHVQQEELADFLENAVEGLHQVGPDGRILWANQAQLRLLGYAAEEYVGHHFADFHLRGEVFDELWRRLMRRESVYDYPAELRCRNGSIKHVLIHSNGRWENGKFLYTRCFIRDVTERKQLEDELKRKLEQLAEADRRKDEFLAMLGHELRNPLSAVRNAVVTARLDPSRRERALDIAHRQTDQLGWLVDDLLDVARITRGRIMLRKQQVSLAAIVEQAVEGVRSFIEDRGHALTVSPPPDDVRLEADPARLEQVLVNLLTNAAKYTPPGGRIDVTAARHGDEVVISVRDSGIGIAAETLPRVFDLFTQAARGLDRAQGGLGIGLTVARRLVELHGGRIEARSEGAGKGAEFVVRLAAPRAAGALAPAPHAAQPFRPGRARIVLVEDNLDAAETLTMLLELLGHDVRVVHDGVAAIDVARANPPDVMLMDIGLPGMDGYEVARRIRQSPDLKHIVLVALTGYGADDDRQRAFAAGFDHHLVKPVNLEKLEGLVTRLGMAARVPEVRRTVH